MERAPKHDQALTAGDLLGQLDGAFNGLGPRVGEGELLDSRRGDLDQPLGRLDQGVVAEDASGMEEAIDLSVGGRDHGRMVVSQVDHCRSAGEVGVSAPVGGVNPDSLGALGDDFGVEGDDRGDDVSGDV